MRTSQLLLLLCLSQSLRGQVPFIEAIDPTQGPIAGGTMITIRGGNFQGATISVDKNAITPESLTDQEIRFAAPSRDNGIALIRVSNPVGVANGEFLYLPPKLSDLPPGYITTVAGIGEFTGFYRVATQAVIDPAGSPAFDQAGNMYIPEPGKQRVTRVRGDGIIEPFAGSGLPQQDPNGDGGPAEDAIVNFPRGVTTDANGYVYITENRTGRLRRVDTRTGIITTIAGNGKRGFSGDGGPALNAQLKSTTHITGDGRGTLFFIDFDSATADAKIRKVTPDGIITTVAGTGTPGFSGDGGPASQAQLNLGFDDRGSLALDPQGNLYIADSGNYRIRRIDAATSVITTVLTLDPNQQPPLAVAVDKEGNFYCVSHAQFLKSGPYGEKLATWGDGKGLTYSPDGTPIEDVAIRDVIGLAIDPLGNIVYVEQILGAVRRLNLATGLVETIAGKFPGIDAGTTSAAGTVLRVSNSDLAFLPNGDLLVGDSSGLFGIQRIDVNGGISTFSHARRFALADPKAAQPYDQAVSIKAGGAGTFYLSDAFRIYRFDETGATQLVVGRQFSCGYSGDGGPAIGAQVCQPWDVAGDGAGNYYIADTNNNRIRRVDGKTGIITTVAGSGPVNGVEHYGPDGQGTYCGDGGPATQACLNTPYGVAVGPGGDLFIADSNGRIRRVDDQGTITTFAKVAGVATKIAVDSAGNLYTVLSNEVVRYDPGGNVTRIAGDGATRGFSGDGGPALKALVQADSQARAIAIDAEGNIFFTAPNHQRVRAIRYGAVLPPANASIHALPAALHAGGPTMAAVVLDSSGQPAAGVRVEFSSPQSGPSCRFSNGANQIGVITDRSGLAQAMCTANAKRGTYRVMANPAGSAPVAEFELTNN